MARKASVLALVIGIVTLCSWSTPVATGPSAAMTPDEFVRSWNERSASDQLPQLKCADRTTVTTQAGRLALRPTCDGTGAIVKIEIVVPSDAEKSRALLQRTIDALYSGRAPETLSAKLLSEGRSDGGNGEVSLDEFQGDSEEKTVELTVSSALQPPTTTTSAVVSTTTSSVPATTTSAQPTTTMGGGGGGGGGSGDILLWLGDHAAALLSIAGLVGLTAVIGRFLVVARRKKRNLAAATLGVIDKRIGPI